MVSNPVHLLYVSPPVAMSTFAARYLRTSQDLALDAPGQHTPSSSSSRSSYLSGIFISVDTDADGLITRPQLVQALALAGVLPREQTVAAFFDARRKSLVAAQPPARRASAASASTAAALQALIDLPTFIAVISATLDRESRPSATSAAPHSHSTASALDPLLSFMTQDNADKSMLSAAQLHHLLVQTLSPTRLGEAEFSAFMAALQLPASIKARARDEECIPVDLLKSRLALPN